MTTRILTGITTTGTPHLGNYAGAIRPAIAASRDPQMDSFYFLADYHALIKCDDPARIQRSRLEIAATWLALGLDTDKATFYRQSDIPEIPELCWLLTCVAGKGLLNRAHAYKASVDKNVEPGEDPDAGVTMGLFSYPVLMAADILMFNAHKVPVGRDQIQHVEMARDIGQRFNHLFGNGKEFFTMPEALIEESVATLPGLDGRKMSKSYDNTIPLFTSAKDMKDAISRIVTDSRAPGEAKDPDNSHLFTLFQAFATSEQAEAFRSELLALAAQHPQLWLRFGYEQDAGPSPAADVEVAQGLPDAALLTRWLPNVDWQEIGYASLDTLNMLGGATLFTVLLGLPLGVLLFLCGPRQLFDNRGLYALLSLLVNVLRSLPFIILLIVMIPLTLLLTGTSLGVAGAIPPLVAGATPFFARLVETALREVDRGIIEATQAMGASTRQIIFRALLPEARPGIIAAITVTAITLVSYTAMAGVVGAGGLGDLAIRFGYQRFQTDVMLVTVVLMLLLVQLLQSLGDRLVQHYSRK